MFELFLLLFMAFCAGGASYGAFEYFMFERGKKRYHLYTVTTDKNEFVGYEVKDSNGCVSKFYGEQRLVEPLMLDFVKGKRRLEDKR